MPNFIQQGIQSVVTWAFGFQPPKDAFEESYSVRQKGLADLVAYYNGDQRRPMKLTTLGKNYNVITNNVKVIVDRSVSMLVGAGVEFDIPGEGESVQDELIETTWDANKKDVLLHDLVQFGSIYGTPAVKIIPEAKVTRDGKLVARLVALNPYNLTVFSAPDDIESITTYVYRWNDSDTAWRELTQRQDNGTWLITIQKADRSTAGQWATQDEPVVWPYEFPPICHGKNLPNAGSIYGMSDIEGVIDLQDKYNESQSNINKILGLQAWAQKYVIGGRWPRTKDNTGGEYIDVGPDKALEFTQEGASVGILQPSGDLASSRQFAQDLRRDMFELCATVDADTVKDKIGSLTNFGLRVLFKNELAKNATKQLLYGDLLMTVNNRLLQLAGFTGIQADPGEVIWGDPLPTNDLEAIQVLTAESSLGIISLQTAAKQRGYDWEEEQERMLGEKQATANVGGNLIRDFLAGRGQ